MERKVYFLIGGVVWGLLGKWEMVHLGELEAHGFVWFLHTLTDFIGLIRLDSESIPTPT